MADAQQKAADPQQAELSLKENLAYKSRGSATGEATAFEDKTYSWNNYQYPIDLMSDERLYGGNYVIFYINVSEDSKLYKDNKQQFVDDATQQQLRRQRGEAVGAQLDEKAVTTGGGIYGAATGAGAQAIGVSGKKAPLVGAAVGVAAAQLIASETSNFSRKQKRMKTAIALHAPVDVQIKYGVSWAEEDTATAAAIFSGAGEAAEALGTMFKGDTDLKGLGKSALINAALSNTGQVGGYVSALTGMAANPKKEQLFKGVDFRTFTFTYQFFPRSEQEAQNVRNIIKEFKYHMHPEFKDAYNFIYLYPSEFDIYYYQNGRENLNIHRHTSCVLTDLSINYAPQGTFTTFDDGMPTQINVTLTFKELALLTKDHIADGF